MGTDKPPVGLQALFMDTAQLTRAQVATRLGLSPERVRQLTVDGRLACTQTPLGRLYDQADVDAYAQVRQQRRDDATIRQQAQLPGRSAHLDRA